MPPPIRLKISDCTEGPLAPAFGVNVEIQEHADRTNLWDWLADSGAGILREFHPDKSLRRTPLTPEDLAAVRTRADFEAFREAFRSDPAGRVDLPAYRFDEEVPWLGTPNAIAAKLAEMNLPWVCSLGYGPADYARRVLRQPSVALPPPDESVHWDAVAAAYEYAFTLAWHFGGRFGVRRFLHLNEPEFRLGGYSIPEPLEKAYEAEGFRNVLYERTEAGRRIKREVFAHVAPEQGLLAMAARAALDDAADALGLSGSSRFRLAGPVSQHVAHLWDAAGDRYDTLDYHQYDVRPEAFAGRHRAMADLARAGGQTLSLSEFNRVGGGVPLDDILFRMERALEAGTLMHRALTLGGPGDPAWDFLTFYVFSFPSTHRNYKHLVYGDLNVADWLDRDQPPWSRGEAWHPTFDELQLRHATPAYDLFRMMTRLSGEGRRVVFDGLPESWAGSAVEKPGEMIVTIFNPSMEDATLELDLNDAPGRCTYAVIRETSRRHRDRAVKALELDDARLTFNVPGMSVVQVILRPRKPSGPFEAIERTFTPGSLVNLGPLQTTRIRVHRGGEDVTGLDTVFESSAPEEVWVSSTGLVQRRRGTGAAEITARSLADGAEVRIPVAACRA